MPNYQEMKLKNKKHYESSMDKSLRPPVSFALCRNVKTVIR